MTQTKNGLAAVFGLVALESAAVANTVLVALVAEQFTVRAVFLLCRLERQLVDRGAAF